MQLTAFFQELGHPVAYYARLTKITGSATATIFLCQLLYWEGKQRDPDGWIYKTQAEIEDETGLTRSEQEEARKALKKVGLLEERFKGLPRRLEFRPVLDAINRQWEHYLQTGESLAIAARKTNSDERVNRIKNARNPSKTHNVLSGQTITPCQETIECPARPGNLYTETTNQRLLSETTIKDKSLKVGFSFPKEEKDEGESRVAAIAKLDAPKNEPPKLPATVPKMSINFEPVYDASGWLQLPRAKRYKLARLIAVRRAQALLSLHVLPETAELVLDKTGAEPQKIPGQVGIHNLKGDVWLWEDQAYASNGPLSLKALRSYAVKQAGVKQATFNKMLAHFFIDSAAWCQQHQDDAIAILKERSILEIFADADKQELLGN